MLAPETNRPDIATAPRVATRTVVDVAGLSWHLTPGVIDTEAVMAFTRGHCTELALALHDHTGWPLRIVVQANIDWMGLTDHPEVLAAAERGTMIPDAYLQKLWTHVLVERPDGWLVDITGARSRDTVLDGCDGNGAGTMPVTDGPYRHRILAATRGEVESLISTAPASPGAGVPFVDAVLALPALPERPWPWQQTIAGADWSSQEALEELAEYCLLNEALHRGLLPASARPAAQAFLAA